MPATARKIDLDAKDLEASGGGAYAELETPGDYEMVLRDVQDYDKRKEGKSWGWIFVYDVIADSGAELEFKVFLSFSKGARWKLVKALNAHQADLTEGLNNVDPNAHIGEVIGGTVDFPRDKDGQPKGDFREIVDMFPLVEPPALEENDGIVEGSEEEAELVAAVEEAEAELEDPEVI